MQVRQMLQVDTHPRNPLLILSTPVSIPTTIYHGLHIVPACLFSCQSHNQGRQPGVAKKKNTHVELLFHVRFTRGFLHEFDHG
jgi:hypothetical protein